MYPIMQEVSKLSELATSNPQAIMQKYAQDPQVKYLLALNEAKRLKEAMQRNQAMQAPAQPTVMQSLEQQSGLASLAAPPSQGEMAEDVGGVLQFQAKKQQENLQRMAQQGLPAAPGAATAMTPQAMAAGGIVAFRRGGEAPFTEEMAERARELERLLEEARARREAAESGLRAYTGLRQRSDPAGYEEAQRNAAEAAQGVRELEQQYSGLTRVSPSLLGSVPIAARPLIQQNEARPTPAAPGAQAPTTPAAPPYADSDIAERADRMTGMVTPPPDTTTQAQPPAGATPPPATPTGPGATSPELSGISTSRAPTDFERNTQSSLQTSMAQDPLSMAERVANSIQGRMDYTPDERKPLQQQRAGLEALLAERRAGDRERQLSAFLRSAGGGRTFGETLGRASSGAAAAEEQAYRERLKGIEDIGKLGMADVELGRTGRVEGAKQIGPMAKAGIEALSSAQRSATDLAGTISREGVGFAQLDQRHKETAAELQSKGYDRENAMAIATMRQRAEADVARATREATTQRDRETKLVNLQRNEGTEIARHETIFNQRLRLLQANLIPGSPEEKAAKNEIAKLENNRDLAIANTRRYYMGLRNELLGTSGATVTPAKD